VKKVHPGQVDFLNPGESPELGLRVRLKRKEHVAFFGKDARKVASKVFPLVNREGAKLPVVKDAVSLLSEVGGPEAFLEETWGKARPRPGSSIRWVMSLDRKGANVGALDGVSSIAIEMALHEEQERRALEGELQELKAAWRAAEELAQISDGLLLPEDLEEKMVSLKDSGTAEDAASGQPKAGG
jgi:hypothetical protein